jgi:hypothetical protein
MAGLFMILKGPLTTIGDRFVGWGIGEFSSNDFAFEGIIELARQKA